MSNKKQTAVEWLWEQIDNSIPFHNIEALQNIETFQKFNGLLEQAKAMEKEQMINFGFDTYCFISGIMKVPFEQLSENRLNAEHNYKETYE